MKNNCNLTSCRYNKDGKCENEEKRKECVAVSKLILCEPTERKNVQFKHEEDGELLLFYDGKLVNDKIMRCIKTEKENKTIFTVVLKWDQGNSVFGGQKK